MNRSIKSLAVLVVLFVLATSAAQARVQVILKGPEAVQDVARPLLQNELVSQHDLVVYVTFTQRGGEVALSIVCFRVENFAELQKLLASEDGKNYLRWLKQNPAGRIIYIGSSLLSDAPSDVTAVLEGHLTEIRKADR